MNRSVFVAVPMSNSTSLELTKLAIDIEEGLAHLGWQVRPSVRRRRDELVSEEYRTRLADFLAWNIYNVKTSSLLVIVTGSESVTSSIWVEAGVALGNDVPCVVVSHASAQLPFLVGVALATVAGDDASSKTWRHIELPHNCPVNVPEVVDEIDRWASRGATSFRA